MNKFIKAVRKAIHCVIPAPRDKRNSQVTDTEDHPTDEPVVITPTDTSRLIGMTVIATGHCASCPLEHTDCVKLILADGANICLVRPLTPSRLVRSAKSSKHFDSKKSLKSKKQ